MAPGLIPADERPVTPAECEALVDRLAASVELRRAARLRAFLLYVSDRTLHHACTGLHEQEIGSAVFGRPAGYDTGIDNIVRVNATELRKRLEHYFAEEGAGETLVLEIQRGSYVPVFSRRLIASPEPAVGPAKNGLGAAGLARDSAAREPAPQEPAAATPAGVLTGSTAVSTRNGPGDSAGDSPVAVVPARRLHTQRWWQAAAALLLVATLALAWQNRELTLEAHPWRRSPAVRALWGNFFDSGQETDLLLADTSFALAEDMMQRTISITDYLNYSYKRFAEAQNLSEAQRHDLRLVLERNNGSIADFRVGQQILALDPGRLTLTFAREFTPDAAKHHSMVLIGARQSNPWVGLFAGKLNFDIEYDPAVERPYVVNHAPEKGESPTYPAAASHDPPGTSYAVIAYLPDLSGKGRALLIEGCDSQATGAAGDFVTNEDSLALLEQKFPSPGLPFFEVLLRTSQLSGTPLRGEVIAFRIHPGNAPGKP